MARCERHDRSDVCSSLRHHGARAVRIAEQNFDYDLIKPSTILDKSVGRDVTVVHDALGAQPRTEKARLLSDTDGVVLQYADRIETGLVNSHLSFSGLPSGLRDRPTLTLDLASERDSQAELDLAYLTGGLSWHAEYVGVVSPGDDRMQINGLVTIENQSGTNFPNARVQLVAGNVNVPQPELAPNVRQFGAISKVSAADAVTQENYFEYHL